MTKISKYVSAFYRGEKAFFAGKTCPKKGLGVTIEERALDFATAAHASIDQRRKYTGEPYIVHPIAVAEIVRSVPHTPEMIAAA